MDLFSLLKGLRHHLHAYPELGFQEVQTQAALRSALEQHAHIPPANFRSCASTGLVVDIDGPGCPTRCIAFRSDMDALPMTECNAKLTYKSTEAAVAHMCGHDGHMTTLVGFAIVLMQKRELLPKNTRIRLLFQPSEEENPGGAIAMIKDGCLEGVDEVYGYHNYGFPLGQVHVLPGAVMAHEQEFNVVIHGHGGHGSAPQNCKDPIVIAAQIVNAVQTIISRSLSPYDTAVVSITQIHAGQVNNVIPSTATLGGTMRDYDPKAALTIRKQFEAIVNGVCTMNGATCTISFTEGYPAVVNSVKETEIVQEIAKSCCTLSTDGLPLMASEDMSYYLQERPGCFYFLGTKEPNDPQVRDLHSDQYDFNDKALPLGVKMFLKIAQHRLGCTLYTDNEFDKMLHA
ncbi:metalloprotease family M20D [Thraustotheca clavata]|uniref:Metalloprotease family M20D n=1 Tax=Thraustotheca clavata TaxID=74557 RepID=A0A1W0A477_9STRA|nr:metalloprotease family M20D [Thraustotheca clavata]